MFRRSIGSNYVRVTLAALMLILVAGMSLAANRASIITGNGWASGQQSAAAPLSNGPSGAAQAPQGGQQSANDAGPATARVGHAAKHDTSPALRDLVSQPPTQGRQEAPENPLPGDFGPQPDVKDPVLQNVLSPLDAPPASKNFNGMGNLNGVLPPDTSGDVGPNHYVQMINLSLQIWNKNGVSLYGPVNGNTVWSGFGGPCQTRNDGDPIVLYDSMADRWLLSQFTSASPYYECIAISTSPDPTGSYHRYAFQLSTTVFYDYPHFGVWPDGYYMSANKFAGGSGPAALVFDRDSMLAGNAATYQEFVPSGFNTVLPADLDGSTLPPAGAPNVFASFGGSNTFSIWRFHVDWDNPGLSTFTGPTNLTTAGFDSDLCGNTRERCVTQPSTAIQLEALSDRLMHRLAYRNFGTHEVLLANHTVDVGSGRAGIRWYEIRNTNTTPSIFQQGTYAPADGLSRWMGSIAMDTNGNIGLSYSVSSSSQFPSIRYTGRLAGDPAGTLQSEVTLVSGAGSQTHSASRWGDYSSMSIDPVDDCTFWFTTEYMPSTGNAPWQTRIGAFKWPSCAPGPTNTPTISPTRTRTPTATVSPTPTASPTNVTAFARIDLPNPFIVSVGTKFGFDLVVDSGANNITAAQNYITFTNSLLQNVQVGSSSCVAASTLTNDQSTFDTVLQNEVCNGPGACASQTTNDPGSMSFASGGLNNCTPSQPCSGEFRVARAGMCATAVGTGTLHWQFAPSAPAHRNSKIVDESGYTVSNQTLYSDQTVQVMAAAPLPFKGHVTIEGRPDQPNPLQSVPVTLTLQVPGGGPATNYSATTGPDGVFTVNVPPGTYYYRVKSAQTLANVGTVNATGSPTPQDLGLLRTGDANNDNCVEVSDFNLLKGTFGRSSGDPQYDARADFDGSGTVDVSDFSLLKGNFGTCGAEIE